MHLNGGMCTVSNQVVVVLGSTGRVGGGIAASLLDAGATVIAPIRSPEKEKAIGGLRLSHGDRLICYVQEYGTLQGAQDLAETIKSAYPHGVDHIIVSAGGVAKMMTLTEVATEQEAFLSVMESRVLSQIILADALFPLLKECTSSSFTIVTGRLGEVCTNAKAALYTIASSCVYGIVQALRKEFEYKPQRINELRIGALIRGLNEQEHPDFPGIPSFSAKVIGEQAVKLLSGEVSAADGGLLRVNLGQGI